METLVIDVGTDRGNFKFFRDNYCIHGNWEAEFDLPNFNLYIPYTRDTIKIKRYCYSNQKLIYDNFYSKDSNDFELVDTLNDFDPTLEEWKNCD